MLVYFAAAPGGWVLLPVAFLTTAIASVLVINLQLRLMDVAGDAVTLGAAMNHAALNIANALGAWLGGLVIAAGHGYRHPRSSAPGCRCSAWACCCGPPPCTVETGLRPRAERAVQTAAAIRASCAAVIERTSRHH